MSRGPDAPGVSAGFSPHCFADVRQTTHLEKLKTDPADWTLEYRCPKADRRFRLDDPHEAVSNHVFPVGGWGRGFPSPQNQRLRGLPLVDPSHPDSVLKQPHRKRHGGGPPRLRAMNRDRRRRTVSEMVAEPSVGGAMPCFAPLHRPLCLCGFVVDIEPRRHKGTKRSPANDNISMTDSGVATVHLGRLWRLEVPGRRGCLGDGLVCSPDRSWRSCDTRRAVVPAFRRRRTCPHWMFLAVRLCSDGLGLSATVRSRQFVSRNRFSESETFGLPRLPGDREFGNQRITNFLPIPIRCELSSPVPRLFHSPRRADWRTLSAASARRWRDGDTTSRWCCRTTGN